MPYRLEASVRIGTNKPWKVVYSASYAFNSWLDRASIDKEMDRLFLQFGNESNIRKPSSTPVFADSMWFDTYVMTNDPPARDLYLGDDTFRGMSIFTTARHGSRGTAHSSLPVAKGQSLGPSVNNVVFFDGHVQPTKLDNLWKLDWHKEWVPPAKIPPW